MTTSGTTGLPKSCLIKHSSLVNLTLSLTKYPFLWNDKQISLQTSRCSFDVHITDIFCTLSNNSTIVMLHKYGILDINYINHTIYNHKVNTVFLVPSLLSLIYG